MLRRRGNKESLGVIMNELSIDLLPMNETQTEKYGMFIPLGGEMDFTYMQCWFRIYQKLHLKVKSNCCIY